MKTLSQASLGLTDVYLKNSKSVYFVFTSPTF